MYERYDYRKKLLTKDCGLPCQLLEKTLEHVSEWAIRETFGTSQSVLSRKILS